MHGRKTANVTLLNRSIPTSPRLSHRCYFLALNCVLLSGEFPLRIAHAPHLLRRPQPARRGPRCRRRPALSSLVYRSDDLGQLDQILGQWDLHAGLARLISGCERAISRTSPGPGSDTSARAAVAAWHRRVRVRETVVMQNHPELGFRRVAVIFQSRLFNLRAEVYAPTHRSSACPRKSPKTLRI
jgi:hypothetical protein